MASSIEKAVLNLLLDPEIRTVAIPYIENWMMSESWLHSFVQCLKNPAYANRVPGVDEFVIDLHHTYNVSQEECEYAAAIIIEHVAPTSFDNAIHHLQEFIRNAHMTSGIEIIAAGNDKNYKARGIESIKTGINIQLAVDTFFDFSDHSAIDEHINSELPSPENLIPSKFSFINKALTYKAFKKGDLVAVQAASGIGKSTYLVTEGAHFSKLGYKVCHVVLGDLSETDMFLKYVSAYNNVETEIVLSEGYRQYLTPDVTEYFKNVRVKSLLPDTYDIYQLLGKVNQLKQKFNYDVLIVDYDGNIKEAGDNLYLNGGQTYAHLKGHGMINDVLVLVASQTKIAHWDDEYVPKTAMNDSSKKQMHLDVLLGLGRSKNCPLVGKLNATKVRRGASDVFTYVALENAKGLITEITKAKYDEIAHQYEIAKNNSLEFTLEQAGITS